MDQGTRMAGAKGSSGAKVLRLAVACLLVVGLVAGLAGWSQTALASNHRVCTWKADAASILWATPANWSCAPSGGGPGVDGPPAAGDEVVIVQGTSFQPTLATTTTIGALTLTSGALTLGAGANLTVTGTVTSGAGTIAPGPAMVTVGGAIPGNWGWIPSPDAGAVLRLQGNATLPSGAAPADLSIHVGPADPNAPPPGYTGLAVPAAATIAEDLQVLAGGRVVVTNGLTVGGNLEVDTSGRLTGGTGALSVAGNATVQSGGELILGAGTTTVTGTLEVQPAAMSIPAARLVVPGILSLTGTPTLAGAIVEFTRAGDQTVPGVPVGALVLAGSGTKTLTTGLTATTTQITPSGPMTLTGAGSLGGTTINSGGAVTLGTGAFTLGAVTLAQNANVALSGDRVTTTVSVGTNATLDLGTHALSGTVSVPGSASVIVGGPAPTFASPALGDGSTVTYNGAGDQTIAPAEYKTLVLAGSGTKTLSSSDPVSAVTTQITPAAGGLAVTGAGGLGSTTIAGGGPVTLGTGAFTLGAVTLGDNASVVLGADRTATSVSVGTGATLNTGTHTLTGPVSVPGAGSVTVGGTAPSFASLAAASTVTLSGAAQTIPPGTYGTVSLAGGTKTLGGNVTIAGDLRTSGTPAPTITPAGHTVTFESATARWIAPVQLGAVEVKGNGTRVVGAGASPPANCAAATQSGSLQVTTLQVTAGTLCGPLSASGLVTVSGGALQGSTATMNGGLTVSGGAVSGTVGVPGPLTVSGGSVTGTTTVTGVTTVTGGLLGGTATLGNGLAMTGGSLGGATTVTGDATASAGTIGGTVVLKNGLAISGTAGFADSVSLTFDGPAAQTWSFSPAPSVPVAVRELVFDNPLGVAITGGTGGTPLVLVAGERIELSQGVVTLGSGGVLSAAGTVVRPSTGGHVNGALRRQIVASAGTVVFPVGGPTAYTPLTLLDVGMGTNPVTLEVRQAGNAAGNKPSAYATVGLNPGAGINRSWTIAVTSQANGIQSIGGLRAEWVSGDVDSALGELALDAGLVASGQTGRLLPGPSRVGNSLETGTVPVGLLGTGAAPSSLMLGSWLAPAGPAMVLAPGQNPVGIAGVVNKAQPVLQGQQGVVANVPAGVTLAATQQQAGSTSATPLPLVDGGVIEPQAVPVVQPQLALSDGTYQLQFRYRSPAGTQGTAGGLNLIIDTVPPVPNWTAPVNNTVSTAQATLQWTGSDLNALGAAGAGILDYTINVRFLPNQEWLTLQTANGQLTNTTLTTAVLAFPGNYQVRMQARDRAGNVSAWVENNNWSFTINPGPTPVPTVTPVIVPTPTPRTTIGVSPQPTPFRTATPPPTTGVIAQPTQRPPTTNVPQPSIAVIPTPRPQTVAPTQPQPAPVVPTPRPSVPPVQSEARVPVAPAVNVDVTLPGVGLLAVTLRNVTQGGPVELRYDFAPPVEGYPAEFAGLGSTLFVTAPGVVFETAQLCVPWDPAEVQAAGVTPDRLRLLHLEDGLWHDITEPDGLQPGALRVCGVTRSFSPFVLGAWTGVPPVGPVPPVPAAPAGEIVEAAPGFPWTIVAAIGGFLVAFVAAVVAALVVQRTSRRPEVVVVDPEPVLTPAGLLPATVVVDGERFAPPGSLGDGGGERVAYDPALDFEAEWEPVGEEPRVEPAAGRGRSRLDPEQARARRRWLRQYRRDGQ